MHSIETSVGCVGLRSDGMDAGLYKDGTLAVAGPRMDGSEPTSGLRMDGSDPTSGLRIDGSEPAAGPRTAGAIAGLRIVGVVAGPKNDGSEPAAGPRTAGEAAGPKIDGLNATGAGKPGTVWLRATVCWEIIAMSKMLDIFVGYYYHLG
jgi:hypothetical protein